MDELDGLERQAGALEIDGKKLLELLGPVSALAREHLDGLEDGSAYHEPSGKSRELREHPICDDPMPLDRLLALFRDHVERPGINITSPRYMGYIPSGGLPLGAMADFLAAITNRYSGLYFVNPGAVVVENEVLRWIFREIGYPETAGGAMMSGGSLANLTAVVAARDAHDVSCRNAPKAVVYLTEHAHHCIRKALHIAGLSCAKVRAVPVDGRCRMNADALERAVVEDRAAGLSPWLIVATAGTTNTGSVDPLNAAADVAERHGLWLHVDGAYGAFFVLCPEGRAALAGIERADSIILDPHKTLFLPYGSGAVVVKDRKHLLSSFSAGAAYIRRDTAEEEPSPADLSPELSRHFRGLRAWMPLKLLGVAPFRAALWEKILLARRFHESIAARKGFSVGPFPDLSIATFRYVPESGDADLFNRRLEDALKNDGRVYFSGTTINGQYVLRAAILSFRTHKRHVDLAVAAAVETAAALEKGGKQGGL